MNKEYIEAIKYYFNERLKSQLKDKFSKCESCSQKKQFINKPGKLIYSCGSKSGKCGPQMIITLPEYLYYPEMKSETTRILNELIDLEQFKDIFSKKEINIQKEIKKDNQELLKKCKKPFSEQNQLKARENLIKKTHQTRINIKKDQNILLSKIKDELDEDKKQTLMKEYLQLNKILKEDYKELIKSNKPLNKFLIVKEGIISKEFKLDDSIEESDKKIKDEIPKINKNLIKPLQNLVKKPMNNQRLNIIVAYRNTKDGARKKQLETFIEQMNLIFEGQTKYHIYIIEQESNRDDYDDLPELIQQEGSKMAKFNLGRLKNIGFKIAQKQSKKDKKAYYVLSDVDLIPSLELIDDYLKYPDNPIHLANKGTRYDEGKFFLGGVLSVNEKDFEKVNGYPNNFWGWGGEDNALLKRFNKNKINITKSKYPIIDLEKYTLKQKLAVLKKDKMKEMRKIEKLEEDKTTWNDNGLSNLDKLYKIEDKSKNDNVTHYKVFLEVDKDLNEES